MPNDIVATSPARTSDARGGEGLTSEQAAARLFANAAKAAPKATEQVAEKPTPEPEAQPNEVTATEAQSASAETAPEDAAQAEAENSTTETTEPESGTEDATDDVLSPATLDEKLKAKIQKRIDKERAARGALERKVSELEAKLNSRTQSETATTNGTPAPNSATTGDVPLANPNQPLAKVNDLGALKQQEQLAKDALRWAEDTLDNPSAWKIKTDINPDTGEEVSTRYTTIGKDSYDEKQIRTMRRDAKIMLEDHIPQRREYITQRVSATKVARENFSFLTDKNAPEYAHAQAMLRDPWVNMRPDAEWFVGVAIKGIKALESEKAAAAKKLEPTKPKAPATRPSNDQSAVSASGSPSRVSADAAQRLARQQERKGLVAKGGITAAEAAAFLERNSNSRKSG